MDEQMQQQMMPPPPPIGSTIRKMQSRNLLQPLKFEGILDWEECEWLIDFFNQNEEAHEQAGIGSGAYSTVDEKIRKAKVFRPQLHELWELNPNIMQKLQYFCSEVNDNNFGYDINVMSQIDILEYEPDGHYRWHNDSGDFTQAAGCRKLTFTFELSDSDDYEGGQLMLGKSYLEGLQDGKTEEDMLQSLEEQKEQGTCVVFSSFMEHKVYPLTEGKRYAMVIWMNGPGWV